MRWGGKQKKVGASVDLAENDRVDLPLIRRVSVVVREVGRQMQIFPPPGVSNPCQGRIICPTGDKFLSPANTSAPSLTLVLHHHLYCQFYNLQILPLHIWPLKELPPF